MATPKKTWIDELRFLSKELSEIADILEKPLTEGGEGVGADQAETLRTRLEAAVQRLESVSHALPTVPARGPRILVVDDDSTNREVLEGFLGRYGPVETASDGQEALSTVVNGIRSGQPFQIIALDVMMPGMDGMELLSRIRRLEDLYSAEKPAMIAMTTAVGARDSVLEAQRRGTEAYFVKPLDLPKLGSWVESLDLGQG